MSLALDDVGGLLVVAGHPGAARVVAAGLHAMQSRGALGADLAVADGASLHVAHGEGPVAEALPPERVAHLLGGMAVGLVRGLPGQRIAMGRSSAGWGATAVAGALTNGVERWQELLDDGALASGGSDAELLLQLVARSRQRTFVNRLVDAIWKVQGAYTMAAVTPSRVVALRDPAGFRPLWLGHMGEAVLIASDDQAIEAVGGRLERPLRPGEMLVIDEGGVQSIAPLPSRGVSGCTQEVVALAPRSGRPFAEPALAVRQRLGARLADAHPAPGIDAVVSAPGAAEDLAAGFARTCGVRFVPAFVQRPPSPYLALEPDEPTPLQGTVPGVVAGASVALITASLTHGHHVRQQVSDLLAAGASAVHVRCGAPPMRVVCPYGVRVRGGDVMAVSRHPEADDLAAWLGAASVAWLGADALTAVLGDGRCEACMNTHLPLDVRSTGSDQLALFAGADQTDSPPSTRKA